MPSVFEILFDNALYPVGVITEKGHFSYVNPKFIDLLGYSAREFENMHLRAVMHPDDIDKVEQRFKKRLKGIDVPSQYEVRIVSKAGETIPVEFTINLTEFEGSRVSFAFVRDISARKSHEKELETLQKRLKNELCQKESALAAISQKAEQNQEIIDNQKVTLENMNEELVRTNQALSYLLSHMRCEQDNVEKKAHATITTKIMPIIKDLQKSKELTTYLPEINAVAEHLSSLSPKNHQHYDIINLLTEMEVKVAALVKEGKTSKAIAQMMHISVGTVKVHRKNIRKKLNIKHSKTRLSMYLKSAMGND
jgi:PAS domain S-box-containing protein